MEYDFDQFQRQINLLCKNIALRVTKYLTLENTEDFMTIIALASATDLISKHIKNRPDF